MINKKKKLNFLIQFYTWQVTDLQIISIYHKIKKRS